MLENNRSDHLLKLKKQSRVFPFLGIFLVFISIFVYMYYVKPLSVSLAQTRENLISQDNENMDLQNQIQLLESSKESLDLSTQVQRNLILNAVPKGMNQDEVIKDIINISEHNDIELKSIGFGKGGSGSEGVNTLRINASFDGSFTDLTNFLEGIEQNGRLFQISSISVQVTRLDIGDFKRANFSLSMESYFQ